LLPAPAQLDDRVNVTRARVSVLLHLQLITHTTRMRFMHHGEYASGSREHITSAGAPHHVSQGALQLGQRVRAAAVAVLGASSSVFKAAKRFSK
jgi:hypothetical protein